MERTLGNIVRTAIDLAVLVAAAWVAFLIRFDGSLPFEMVKRAAFTTPYVVVFQFSLLVISGTNRFAWRHVGLPETRKILIVIASAAVGVLAVRLLAGALLSTNGYAIYAIVPIGVIAADFLLAFLGIVGVRFLRRMLAEKVVVRPSQIPEAKVPTLLLGAGQAGALVASEIGRRPGIGILAVGFLDDDPAKKGSIICGLSVLGPTSELRALADRTGAKQALICLGLASGKQIRRINALCEEAGIPAKIIPPIAEIVSGHVNLSRIRAVSIEDLLGREPVVLDTTAIAEVVKGRVVLISGAGGSIGSELCRQVCKFGPARLVLLEQAENNIFQIHRQIVADFPGIAVVPCVGDVCDAGRIAAVFDEQRPEVVFHAAAHKHVPMMEWNPGEAIKNNVLGTKTLADVAHAHRVANFVMISTDKAVNPTSVMGASKRIAELYIQALSRRSETRFVTVRFGNVLGSVGSVVPIFTEQIARGGPVTVTHPEMKRYFMTIPEACQLVLQAGSMGKGGEIFVLDMGEPVRIADLARDLIRLSGLRPDVDIEIQFSGVRPGEKLFEELSVAGEAADKTRHAKIFIGRTQAQDYDEVTRRIEGLKALADGGSAGKIKAAIARVVPEYSGAQAEVASPPSGGAAPHSVGSPERAVSL